MPDFFSRSIKSDLLIYYLSLCFVPTSSCGFGVRLFTSGFLTHRICPQNYMLRSWLWFLFSLQNVNSIVSLEGKGENLWHFPAEPDSRNNRSHQQDIWNTYQCGEVFVGVCLFRGLRVYDRGKNTEKRGKKQGCKGRNRHGFSHWVTWNKGEALRTIFEAERYITRT